MAPGSCGFSQNGRDLLGFVLSGYGADQISKPTLFGERWVSFAKRWCPAAVGGCAISTFGRCAFRLLCSNPK